MADVPCVTVQNFSRIHINAEVQGRGAELPWKMTGFYGHPETANRPEAWSLLRHLSDVRPEPWLCFGDFNEIHNSSEKMSSSASLASQMAGFKEALEECRLLDQGYRGPKFTWCNGRQGNEFNCERLDRAMANGSWTRQFNVVDVLVLPRIASDHNPLLINCSNAQNTKWKKRQQFRYEAHWMQHKEHGAMIKQVWRAKPNQRDHWKTLHGKLNGCQKVLQVWVRKQKQDVEGHINSKLQELHQMQGQDPPAAPLFEGPVKEELGDLLAQEETKWKQRAKENWLKEGDRNAKFFHMCANQKNRRSQIMSIIDMHGIQCTTQATIEAAFTEYFASLFTAGENLEIADSVAALDTKVSSKMNQRLVADFIVEEISAALNQMPALKAPGPDGFLACFYKKKLAYCACRGQSSNIPIP